MIDRSVGVGTVPILEEMIREESVVTAAYSSGLKQALPLILVPVYAKIRNKYGISTRLL